MKKYILFFGIMVLLVAGLKNINAQNILPDSKITTVNDSAIWFPDGTTFCAFNGATYAIIWQQEQAKGSTGAYRWYPYVYILRNGELQPFCINDTCKLRFGYKHEDDYGYNILYRTEVTIVGPAFAFSYYGHLWYSCVIEHPPYAAYYPGTYYQLWARYDPDVQQWTTWYNEYTEKPVWYYLYGLGVDSTLNLYYYDGTLNAILHEPTGIGKDIYSFDPDTKKIVLEDRYGDLDIPGSRIGGVYAYKDTCGHDAMLYNTYDEGVSHNVISNGSFSGNHTWNHTSTAASVLLLGSAQGQRPDETVSPELSNRFHVFYLSNVKNADNSYNLINEEWAFAEYCRDGPIWLRTSQVSLPVTQVCEKIDKRFQLGCSYSYIYKDYSTQIEGTDGMTQQLQVFYPNGDGQIFGAFFNSDIWRPIDGTTVSSIDLADDITYGQQVRDLWTLVGITDGAPPCSIDWDKWDSVHQLVTEPTELTFKLTNNKNTEVTSTYEDAYSMADKISVGPEKLGSIEAGFKWSQTFESNVISSTKVYSYLTDKFGLSEESQELAYYVWAVPQIFRTTYQVYPWYYTKNNYPIVGTMQYRFQTLGMNLITEVHDIAEFPFLISEPNAADLADWTLTHRTEMYTSILNNAVQPAFTLSYTSPVHGSSGGFSEEGITTKSTKSSNSYHWEVGSSGGVPKVFKISETFEYDITYSSEYSYETALGKEVEATMENLLDAQSSGINLTRLDMNVYLFQSDTNVTWWYQEGLNGQTPWYIGYIVTYTHTKLVQLSPEPDVSLRNQDLIFAWRSEEGELTDYELFISEKPAAGPGSTIYRLSCKDRTMANPEDFTPEPGKTYYWSVRGVASTGEVVWSGSRAFTVGAEEPGRTPSLLKASVYPNPGRMPDMAIAVDPESGGTIMVRLININGARVAAMETYSPDGSPVTVSFPGLALPSGIYLAVITTPGEQVVKKVIVK